MISAIITCAGNGSRFGSDKILSEISGEPVLVRTIRQFALSKKIDEIIVAARTEYICYYQEVLSRFGLKVKFVEGGKERLVSAFNGVKSANGDFIVIHDGVRPLTPVWLIDNVVEEARKHQAAMAAVMSTTCIKYVEGSFIKKCLARKKTWLGQTPQAFKKDLILSCYKKALENNDFSAKDDCELVSRFGIKVKIVPGDYGNIKITFPSDIGIAEKIIESSNG
ncbi:hypothetical protein A3J78_01335, partial [Candidatus Beckwithbacteria bacterium RBG_13_35_6]